MNAKVLYVRSDAKFVTFFMDRLMLKGHRLRGLYLGPKMIFIPLAPVKIIFFPPLATCCFSTPFEAFLP